MNFNISWGNFMGGHKISWAFYGTTDAMKMSMLCFHEHFHKSFMENHRLFMAIFSCNELVYTSH